MSAGGVTVSRYYRSATSPARKAGKSGSHARFMCYSFLSLASMLLAKRDFCRRTAASFLSGFDVGRDSRVSPGHAVAARENTLLMIGADATHMICATLWAGGLPVLSWLLWRGRRSRESANRSAVAVRRFSRVALVSVCLLVPSGLYQSVTHVGGLSALLNTAYGNLLTFKLALVGLMLALGALNRFSTKPALARAASSATAEPRAAKAYLPIGWEGALGMVRAGCHGVSDHLAARCPQRPQSDPTAKTGAR